MPPLKDLHLYQDRTCCLVATAMTQPLITVIGSLNADLITRTSRIPSAGETLTSQSFDTGFGGKGANQATACARLSRRYDTVERGDVKVKMVGMVGDDTFGRDIRWPMVSNGIDIADVWVKEGYKTGVAVIIVEEASGENRILLSPNANYALKPIQFATIPGPVPDLIVLQLEIPMNTVLKVLEVAGDKKIPVILNPAPAQALPKEAYKAIRHLIVNESEAAILSEAVMLSETYHSRTPRIPDLPPLPVTPSETSTLSNLPRLPDTPIVSDTFGNSSNSRFSESAPIRGGVRNSDPSRPSDAAGLADPETASVSDSSMLSNTVVGLVSDSAMSTDPVILNGSRTSGSSFLSGTASMVSDVSADAGPTLPHLIDTAKSFHRLGVSVVIITLGARGVFVSLQTGVSYRFPAEKVNAVDTTAAGDTFLGAYAVAIAKYRTKEHSANQILSAVKWANRCAAKTVEKKGAQSAIPWLNEVTPFKLERVVYEGSGDCHSASATSSHTTAGTRSTTPSLLDH